MFGEQEGYGVILAVREAGERIDDRHPPGRVLSTPFMTPPPRTSRSSGTWLASRDDGGAQQDPERSPERDRDQCREPSHEWTRSEDEIAERERREVTNAHEGKQGRPERAAPIVLARAAIIAGNPAVDVVG